MGVGLGLPFLAPRKISQMEFWPYGVLFALLGVAGESPGRGRRGELDEVV